MMSNPKNANGAVLLEALLTVVIFSVAMTIVSQSLVSGLRASKLSSEYLQAAVKLHQALAVQAGPVSVGVCHETNTNTDTDENEPYQLACGSKNISDDVYEGLKMFENETSVLWNSGKNTRKLTAYILAPGTLQQ